MWRPVFDKYDKDKDGRIECDEFRRILQDANNQLSEDIPKEVIDELVERSNWCSDRYITFDEFIKMVRSKVLKMFLKNHFRLTQENWAVNVLVFLD